MWIQKKSVSTFWQVNLREKNKNWELATEFLEALHCTVLYIRRLLHGELGNFSDGGLINYTTSVWLCVYKPVCDCKFVHVSTFCACPPGSKSVVIAFVSACLWSNKRQADAGAWECASLGAALSLAHFRGVLPFSATTGSNWWMKIGGRRRGGSSV